ncbi:MAG TPA: glycoside hydrolase family 97 N-terminal domain-containing protein, partial [Bacteroidota bacterium]|nr:glycoside hydrolase family 97 N-terminal domain-containing protein [Bacteroidota bacterium]
MPLWRVVQEGATILDWSPLGLDLSSGERFASGFMVTGIDSSGLDETYTLVAGKTKRARDYHTELRVRLSQASPQERILELVFRAFDDGAAFRYAIPVQIGMHGLDIAEELTEFRFPGDMSAWAFQINTFHSSFEGLYNPTTLGAIPDTGEVYTPLTMQRTDGITIALTEADLLDYGGMYLRRSGRFGLRVALPPHPDGSGACVHGTLPFASPWRVIMIGRRPADLIGSTIILNLSTPSVLRDVSWIRPGKAIFPWWPDFHAEAPGVPDSLDFENQKYYVDFAAENGMQYLELEPPWYGNTDDCIEHPEKYDITR